MTLHVVPATDADAPRAFQIEHEAYRDVEDPVSPLMSPGPFAPNSTQMRADQMLAAKHEDPTTAWVKVIDDELDGQMIAFAKYHIYPPGTAAPEPTISPPGPGSNPEVWNGFLRPINEKRVELMGGKSYVYLGFLHTDPAHQRRGAGSMLINWGLDKAEELQLPTYLEASRAGAPLYLRHGFKEIGRIKYDLTNWGGEGTYAVVHMLKLCSAESS